MNKKEKVACISKQLDLLFPETTIPLFHLNTYTLLIAVLLSAQCTDKKVNQITPLLFSKATTPKEMIKLSFEELFSIISPCGLASTKAKAILALSKQLIEKFNGEVPSTLEELKNLPGIGQKTASVVLVQGFGIPAFPVDTHIHRCAKRWELSKGKTVKETEEDLKKLFPKNTWGKRHLQIIFYARSYCPARGHHIDKCPICLELKKTLSSSS